MNIFEKIMASLALTSAEVGAGMASIWVTYQPKQPKNMKKWEFRGVEIYTSNFSVYWLFICRMI